MNEDCIGIPKRIAEKKDKENITQIRSFYSLPISKDGKRNCLRCSKEFLSEDIKSNRVCYSCRNLNDFNN